MIDFEIFEPTQAEKWNEYLQCLPIDQQDIYFTPEYYRLYEELGEGKAICFVFTKDGHIALYSFLINSVNELGYRLDEEYYDIQSVYGYNGIISSNKDKDFFKEFYKAFSLFCKKNNLIAEFSRFHPLLKNEAYSKDFMTVIRDRETVVIDLKKDYSKIWELEYASKNRNMIRKAIKLGYKIQVLNDPKDEDLDIFMNIYYFSMRMANAEKYYFFKREYFVNIFKYLRAHAFLFNVIDSKCNVVCSSIFFQYGDYFHYHLSGRNNKADNSVNSFLIDRALDFAKNNGAKLFHLGGGRSSDADDSLLRFKKNFSKQTLPFYIGKRIHNQAIYSQVVEQWENKYPEKIDKYNNLLLKYRY